MESTKQILVQRSKNLFVPFVKSESVYAVGKKKAFSKDPRMFFTMEANGNIHIYGTKSVKDSGYILIGDVYDAHVNSLLHRTVLKNGTTYSYSYNDSYGNASLQYINSTTKEREAILSLSKKTATPTTDITILYIYIDIYKTNADSNIGKTYDFYLNPMLVEGSTALPYAPFYQEYEAAVSRLVRRSYNLLMPTSTIQPTGQDYTFSDDKTLFATIADNGNIHIHGTRSSTSSGYVLLWNLRQGLVLKQGHKYNLSISAPDPGQFILQSNQSGALENIMQVGSAWSNGVTKTMDEDVLITRIYFRFNGTTTIGEVVDQWINPMLIDLNETNLFDGNAKVISDSGSNYKTGASILPLTIPFSGTFNRTIPFTIKPGNHTLEISVGDGEITTGDSYLEVYLQNSSRKNLLSINSNSKNSVNKISTFGVSTEISSATAYLYIYYNGGAPSALKGQDFNYIKIIGDSNVLDYEPYYTIYETSTQKVNDFTSGGQMINRNGVLVENLINFDNAVYGRFLQSSGLTNANDVWAYVPDYVPCKGSTQYYFGTLDTISPSTYRMCALYFYDENRQFIEDSTSSGSVFGPNDIKLTLLSPPNAKYMRIRYSRIGTTTEDPYPKFPYVYEEPTA